MISGVLETIAPLRVGAGRSNDATDVDHPVLKDVLGQPVIPGASVKGALRSYIESIMWACQSSEGPKLVCNIFDQPCVPSSTDGWTSEKILTEMCLTCRVFGSHQAAAKLMIRDLSVETWNRRYSVRNGVAIDRDTGVAAERRLYDFEVVPASTRFQFVAHLDDASPAEQGLVLLAIRALERKQIPLGGARSRGLGWCELSGVHYTYIDESNILKFLLAQDDADESFPFSPEKRQAAIQAFQKEVGENA
jgi:CRISPR-associated RAMP protein (TIGR02581 family)